MFDQHSLSRLFCPASIAVIGASATAGKIGSIPIELLRRFGYAGHIYPVNPKGGEIQGLPAYASLSAIDGDVDLAILAVPAALAYDALADARPGQLKGAVAFTSGFAETGEAGRAEQTRLAALAADKGIRLLGPNCLGFMNIRDNVYATFSPAPAGGTVRAGSIGMVSQSGAFGAYAYTMARERGLGLSYWISTGNEADIDVAECIAWLADDPATRVIMAYMEGCRHGGKLKAALAKAQAAGKPVVVTKVGRTSAGAQAAASHTAALAGDDAVYDALFRQYGVRRAHTIESFFNIGYALDVCGHAPADRSIGIMTVSGGVGALMADDAEEAGLALPPLPLSAQQEILRRVPFAGPRNPVDITGQVTSEPGLLDDAAELMLREGQYGSLLVFLAAAGASEAMWPRFRQFAQKVRETHPATPLAMCSLFNAERRRELEAMGCMVFTDPSAAVRALAAIAPPADAQASAVQHDDADKAVRAVSLPTGPLSEAGALALLDEAGIPVMPFATANSADEAVASAAHIGYPVVLKIVSADITHKSDIGGVRLNLRDADAVRAAYRDIRASVERNAPGAAIEGVMVAPMIAGGVECILGVQRDPVFGPVVMFGLGGVFVETMKDVSFRLAPFGEDEARRMIREVKARALLEGARGRPVADVDALARALARLSQFAVAMESQIDAIDINPFVAMPEGKGALALDAVVVRRAGA